jgi:hypothetical protein
MTAVISEHLFFFSFSTGVSTQCFVFDRKVLYHLSNSASPFCSGYFGDRGSLFAQASLDGDPPSLGFPSAGMIGMHRHTQHFFSVESHKLFCPGWTETKAFLISASQEARITCVSHWLPVSTFQSKVTFSGVFSLIHRLPGRDEFKECIVKRTVFRD